MHGRRGSRRPTPRQVPSTLSPKRQMPMSLYSGAKSGLFLPATAPRPEMLNKLLIQRWPVGIIPGRWKIMCRAGVNFPEGLVRSRLVFGVAGYPTRPDQDIAAAEAPPMLAWTPPRIARMAFGYCAESFCVSALREHGPDPRANRLPARGVLTVFLNQGDKRSGLPIRIP